MDSLNHLQEYCDKWHLSVNLTKTKTIIFNKGGRKIKAPAFITLRVEITNKYCYLGIELCASRSFCKMINEIVINEIVHSPEF